MRVFIDCTLVDFSRQPTGIPRVVVNYINVAYEWSRTKKGVEIIPCVPSHEGMYICRPVPGKNPPKHLLERAIASELEQREPKTITALQWIAKYLSGLVSSLIGIIAAVAPFEAVKSSHAHVTKTLNDLVTTIGHSWRQENKKHILMRPGKGDVVFCPAYWHDVDPTIYRRMRDDGAAVIILVHDILPITHEKYYPSPWKYQFKESVIQTVSYATALYTVSNYTGRCLLEFLIRQKLTPPLLKTAYNGFEPLVDEVGLSIIKSKTDAPFFGDPDLARRIRERSPYVMVGSVEPKKGHIPTVKCFEMMWNAGLDRDLIIVGRKGWMDSNITKTIEGSAFFMKRLFWHSNVDDFDLADLYVHSHGLIFSSVAEGFGIPMVEAAYYGTPAIVYDSPIAREVIGEHGHYFDDAITLIEHVERFETEDGYQMAKERVADFKWHSWEQHAPAVFDSMVQLAKDC